MLLMKCCSAILIFSTLIAMSVHGQKTNTTVLVPAPSKTYPCIERTFYSEAEIDQPFEKLCLIAASEVALSRG